MGHIKFGGDPIELSDDEEEETGKGKKRKRTEHEGVKAKEPRDKKKLKPKHFYKMLGNCTGVVLKKYADKYDLGKNGMKDELVRRVADHISTIEMSKIPGEILDDMLSKNGIAIAGNKEDKAAAIKGLIA